MIQTNVAAKARGKLVGGLALAACLACGSGPDAAPPEAPPVVVDDRPLASAGMGEPWAALGLPPPPPWDAGRLSVPVRGEPGRDLWVQYPEGPGVTRASARDAWRDAALANGWTVRNQRDWTDRSYAHLTRTGGRLDLDVTTRWSWVTVDLRYESKRVVDATWPQAAWCEDGTRPDPEESSGDHACYEVGTEMLLHGDFASWGEGADRTGPPTLAGRYTHGKRTGDWSLEPVTNGDRTYTARATYAEDGRSTTTYTRADGTVAAVFTAPSRDPDANDPAWARTWTWTAPDGAQTAHAKQDATGLSGTVGRSLPAASLRLGLDDQLEVLDVDVPAGLVAYRVKVAPEGEVEWQDCKYPGLDAAWVGVTLGLLDVEGGTNETFVVYAPAGPQDTCTPPDAASAALASAKARFAAVGLSPTDLPTPTAPAEKTGDNYEGAHALPVGAHVAGLAWSRENYNVDPDVEDPDDQVGSVIGEGAVFAAWTWDGAAQDRFVAGYGRSGGGSGHIAWWGAFAHPGDGPPLLVLRFDAFPFVSTYSFLRPASAGR